MRFFVVVAVLLCCPLPMLAGESDGTTAKAVLRADRAGENLLKPDAWRPWKAGFERDGGVLVCDNGTDAKAHRGAGQTVVLDQTVPEPIVAVAESRCQGVDGSADNNYALYLVARLHRIRMLVASQKTCGPWYAHEVYLEYLSHPLPPTVEQLFFQASLWKKMLFVNV